MTIFSLGQLVSGISKDFGNDLNLSNSFDQYSFSTPNYTSENGFLGFSVIVDLLTLTGPVDIVIGQDFNSNGVFDGNEFIGNGITFDPEVLFSDEFFQFFIPIDFLADDVEYSDSQSYLEPGQNYFLQVEKSGGGSVTTYGGTLFPYVTVLGEITTDDDFYCCNSNSRYYYDEFTDDLLGQEIRVGVGGLLTGQEILLNVASGDFQPILIVFDVATGKVLQATDTNPEGIPPGQSGVSFEASLFLSLEAGISYGVSVETLESGATGGYVVNAAVIP